MAFGAVDLCDQMNALLNIDETKPSVAMKLLVDQHGAWAIFRAFAIALMPKRRESVRLDTLSPHMRRDVGLLPVDSARRYRELL